MCYDVVGKNDSVSEYNQAADLMIPGGTQKSFEAGFLWSFSQKSTNTRS